MFFSDGFRCTLQGRPVPNQVSSIQAAYLILSCVECFTEQLFLASM